MNSDSTRTEKVSLGDQEITGKILMLRGQRVILDRDLAELYGVAAFRMREQVKRNKERFPETFMFRLTNKELRDMVSQFAIPSHKNAGGSLPSPAHRLQTR
jgi:hypothetical protein